MSAGAVDPFYQTVNFTGPDGESVPVPMDDLAAYVEYGIEICINYASQIGASAILFVLLVILTKHEKRRSPIFILNCLSLVVNIVRSVLQCLYFTGPFYNPYATMVFDYSQVPDSAYNISITASVFNLLLLICIEASLVLQLRVVCITMSRRYRAWTMMGSVFVALLAIGFRSALTIENAMAIRDTESFGDYAWLSSASNITTSICICFFSICFCAKLGFAIRNRQRLGLKQFGPMQIIFIMGCQTLIIPSLFSILQYVSDVPEFSSQVLTVVAIFLPLSSIWASASIDSTTMGSRGHDAHRKLFGSWVTRSRNRSMAPNRKVSAATYNSNGDDALQSPTNRGKGMDIEMGGREIFVDRDFSVSSEKSPISPMSAVSH